MDALPELARGLLVLPELARGLLVALVLSGAMVVILAIFGAGYRYFVARNHQADDTTDRYADEEKGPRG